MNTHKQIGLAIQAAAIASLATIRRNWFAENRIQEKVNLKNETEQFGENDVAAQTTYVEYLKGLEDHFDYVAEENGLQQNSNKDYVVIDPIDGTKASIRRQTSGVGTMVALVSKNDEEVISAFVGNSGTGEIIGYLPNEEVIYSWNGHSISLSVPNEKKLQDQYIILRDHPTKLPNILREMSLPKDTGGFFKDVNIESGGISTMMIRLWKGEVGAAVVFLPATAWDWCPLYGITKKLGFSFLKVHEDGLEEIEATPTRSLTPQRGHHLIVHKTKIDEIKEWLEGRKK